MDRLSFKILVAALAASAPGLVGAQAAPPATPPPATPAAPAPAPATPPPPPPPVFPVLQGAPTNVTAPPTIIPSSQAGLAAPAPIGNNLPAVDIIPLQAFVGGTPLKHGHVIQGTEHIQLDNRVLSPAEDYAIDYVAGVIYLKCPVQMGDTLVVSYQYDTTPSAQAAAAGAAWGGMQFGLLPGSNVLMGVGLTERQADGSVSTSNLYGWHTAMNFGQKSSLGGLFIVSDSAQSAGQSGFSFDTNQPSPSSGVSGSDSGKSHFMLQDFKSAVMGGQMSLDYQNIGKGFQDFGAVKASGYSDLDVKQFQAEKGLTRSGMSFAGLKMDGLNFNDSIKDVKDVNGAGIEWRNFEVDNKSLKLNYSSQNVSEWFQRFSDLSEADKAQLLKERGMARQNFDTEFMSKAGKITITSNNIDDNMYRSKIRQDKLDFDSTKYKFTFGKENIGEDFFRTANLTAAESAQWTREVGVKREWLSFNAALDSKSKPFTFNQDTLDSLSGHFNERDAAFTGKSWNISHIDLKSTPGFTSMTALQDADVNNQLQKIAAAYSPTVAATPGDKSAYIANSGIGRDYTSVGATFFKGWQTRFDELQLTGAGDKASGYDFSVAGPTLTASFKRQMASLTQTELSGLAPLEQTRWGTLPGLRRADFTLALQLNKLTKLNYNDTIADVTSGGARRTTLDYASKGFELTGYSRRVDPGFTTIGSINDPEASLLASFVGFQQRDAKLTWTSLPHMKLNGEAQDARDEATGEYKSTRNIVYTWDLDKRTQFGITDVEQGDQKPLQTLFLTESRLVSLSHDFGRFGKLQFLDESDVSRGVDETMPDDHKDYGSYEAQITKSTSFKAEQTITNYVNGQHEDISAETVSTQLTKRAGVSVTQVQVDSNVPSSVDPSKTNFGGWYDLGSGVRIAYGYAHQYGDTTGSTASTNLTIGKNTTAPAPSQYGTLQPGTLGPISVAGGYGANQFMSVPGSANHTQAFSNLNLSTVKPIKFGPLSNIRFQVGMDTASDYAAWSKENDSAAVSGSLGPNTFGFIYKGQLEAPGELGIDRGFEVQTSQSPKDWLHATILYKVRTLPNDVDYLIRDFNVSAKPTKNIEITNLLQTNPETANAGVFLGSTPQAAKSDKWQIDYHNDPNTTIGFSYQELTNESSNFSSTVGGLTLKLFQKSGSPLSLFIGQEDSIGNNLPHELATRYSVQFDQKPGPNQTMSLFLGNLSYAFNTAAGFNPQNWSVRCNYQLRF